MAPGRHRAAAIPRRHLLVWLGAGVGTVVVAGAGGLELVDHGVLPGKQFLDQIDGACSVPPPNLSFSPIGPSTSGRFYSRARRRVVAYTIGYPPGHRPGDQLGLVVMLHGYGNDHASALVGMTPAQAVALRVDGRPLNPVAMVTVDGGDGYWNPHPGDDPMSMVVNELIPRCRLLGLGTTRGSITMMGISMGGYGALAIAERHPGLVAAVSAISPAVWTSFEQAQSANPTAFVNRRAFEQGNIVKHADRLRGVAVRVASGVDDPFHPGVEQLVNALPVDATVVMVKGCHTDPFFLAQEPPSVAFVTRHVAVT